MTMILSSFPRGAMTELELVLGIGFVSFALIVATTTRVRSPSAQKAPSAQLANQRMRMEVESERRRIIDAIERERGSKVITLIHRREPWAGKEDAEYITIEDTEHILREIWHTTKDKPLDIIVHTPGGLALAAEMIAIALHNHPGRVTVFVPFYAMSGGTLLALAADECYMERFSVLGPLDPQVDGIPASSFRSVLKMKEIESVDDRTIMLAEIAEKAVKNMKGFVKHLLKDKMDEVSAEKIAEFLTGGYMTHDTPLTFDVAKSLGCYVKEGIPGKVFDLFLTCDFGVCERPSLAYGLKTRNLS